MRNKDINNLLILFVLLVIIFLENTIFAFDPRYSAEYDKNSNNLFYFVQISDTHIGETNKEEYDEDLRWLLNSGLNVINPEIVVNTGDLTDADIWYIPRIQQLGPPQKDEWLTYRDLTKNVDKARYFDLPGNHDRYGDPNWEGLNDGDNVWYGYTHKSVLGPSTRENPPVGQFSTTITVNGNDYLFIGTNTCDEDGGIFHGWWFVSDDPKLSDGERKYIEEELYGFYQINQTPQKKLAFIFGHAGIYRLVKFPTNLLDILDAKEWTLNELGGEKANRGGSDFVRLLNQYNVSAYLFGHTHKDRDLYDLNSQHNISSRLINTSSLTEQDTYRIVAVDNNGVSTKTAKVSEWPVTMITSPLDAKTTGLNSFYFERTRDNLYAYNLKTIQNNFVRAIAFFDPIQTDKTVKYRYKKKSDTDWPEDKWETMENKSGNIWQKQWDCRGLATGEYELEVRAYGIGDKYNSHTITVKIDNSECTFIYPNSGENLKGTFPLKAIINRDLSGVAFAEFYYSVGNKTDWQEAGTIAQPWYRNVQVLFNSEGINSSEVWFKVLIHVPFKDFIDISDEAVIIDNTSPSVPVQLKATTKEDYGIELKWDHSEDKVGFKIYRSKEELNDYSLEYEGINGRIFTDGFVENGVTYSYKIMAYDLAGNESIPSKSESATAKIEPPKIANLFPTDPIEDLEFSITGTVTDSGSGVDKVWVNFNGENGGGKVEVVLDSQSNFRYETTVVSSGIYYYDIWAVDKVGNEASWKQTFSIRRPTDFILAINTGFPCTFTTNNRLNDYRNQGNALDPTAKGNPFVLEDYKREAAGLLTYLSLANF